MESSVHVIIAVRQLIFVSNHSHIKWLEIDGLYFSACENCIYFSVLYFVSVHLGIGDYGLSDSHHSQIVATELVSAVVGLLILD